MYLVEFFRIANQFDMSFHTFEIWEGGEGRASSKGGRGDKAVTSYFRFSRVDCTQVRFSVGKCIFFATVSFLARAHSFKGNSEKTKIAWPDE